MEVNVQSIKKISIESGEKLLVTVDVSELDANEAYEYLTKVKEFFLKQFTENQFIVVPHNIDVKGVIIKDEE